MAIYTLERFPELEGADPEFEGAGPEFKGQRHGHRNDHRA
jgi:hypothetical protein